MDLEEFVAYSHALREPSLIVVDHDLKLVPVGKTLGLYKFRHADTVPQIAQYSENGGKLYFEITKENCKDAYDFIRQYPLGAVDVFDTQKGTQQTYCPLYAKNTLVFIATKDTVKHAENQGLPMLAVAGLTYQFC